MVSNIRSHFQLAAIIRKAPETEEAVLLSINSTLKDWGMEASSVKLYVLPCLAALCTPFSSLLFYQSRNIMYRATSPRLALGIFANWGFISARLEWFITVSHKTYMNNNSCA